MKTDVDRALEDPARRRGIRREELILEVTEAIIEAMQRAGVSASDLAARLGKTRGHVSQVLTGRNVTLGTVAEIADAIGARVEVRLPMRRRAQVKRPGPVRLVRDVRAAAYTGKEKSEKRPRK